MNAAQENENWQWTCPFCEKKYDTKESVIPFSVSKKEFMALHGNQHREELIKNAIRFLLSGDSINEAHQMVRENIQRFNNCMTEVASI